MSPAPHQARRRPARAAGLTAAPAPAARASPGADRRGRGPQTTAPRGRPGRSVPDRACRRGRRCCSLTWGAGPCALSGGAIAATDASPDRAGQDTPTDAPLAREVQSWLRALCSVRRAISAIVWASTATAAPAVLCSRVDDEGPAQRSRSRTEVVPQFEFALGKRRAPGVATGRPTDVVARRGSRVLLLAGEAPRERLSGPGIILSPETAYASKSATA